MSRFQLSLLPLHGVVRVDRQRLGDSRGYLSRFFCADELRQAGWHKRVAQVNHTYTARRGVVRGMHFQRPPFAEMKLVSCLRGAVWDVAVDLRIGSPTFLRWHAELLSAENGRALLIPEGCAHGFQAQTDDVELLYLHSEPYTAEAEGGLHPLDPLLGISWPLDITELSERDQRHAFAGPEFTGLEL